ncbi:DNA-methyltransferase [Desulfovibrio piger]
MQKKFESIVNSLGAPTYRGEKYAIYNGDALLLLKKLPADSIDLFFTSPPYNIGKEYEKIIPINEYIKWSQQWINLVYTATKHNGAFLYNIGYINMENIAHAIPIIYLLWDKIPFYLQQEIIWNYGAGVAMKKYLSPRNEKILWYVKDKDNYCFNLDDIRDPNVLYPNQKKKGKLRCNTLGKNPSDVWQIAKVTSGKNRSSAERTKHPAQFPLDLCERVIKGFSQENEVVIDPFLGSGSTIEACLRHNRYSIGFEINKSYCSIAYTRIQAAGNAYSKLPLFNLQ